MTDVVTQYPAHPVLTTQDKMLIEQRVTNQSPSVAVAYLLWFFLGFLSGHRFYLGRTGSAIAQILLNIIIVGFIWVLIDAFLIPGMIRDNQEKLREKFRLEAHHGA